MKRENMFETKKTNKLHMSLREMHCLIDDEQWWCAMNNDGVWLDENQMKWYKNDDDDIE